MDLLCKKVYILRMMTIFCVSSIFAQPPDTLWTKTYGGIGEEHGLSVQQTTDGGYIIFGETTSFGSGDYDVWLLKTTADGDTLWSQTYGGSGQDVSRSGQQTTDGGYVIAGSTPSAGLPDILLIKTDSLGDTLWTKTYGGTAPDVSYSVQQTSDNGYIIAGSTWSFGAGGENIYIIKTDSLGDTLWTKVYGGGMGENAWSVEQTVDGGYIIGGKTESFGAGSYDIWLLKTDSLGDTLWTRIYGGSNYDYCLSIQQTSDSGYILTGRTASFGAGYSDVWLLKTDSLGDTLWTKTYGGWYVDGGRSVQQTSDGGYIIAGFTYSFGAGSQDAYLIKTAANGDALWTKTYGGWTYDFASAVQQTSDDGYIIVGYTCSFGAGASDIWLIKTAPDTLGIEDNQNIIPKTLSLEVFPNPFKNKTDIRFQITDNSKFDLKIYDATGRLIKEFNQLTSHQSSINQIIWDGTDQTNRQLPSGVYFIKFQAENYYATEKLILIR